MREGLVPPVVMEFPGITTGGGYAGTSGESSSWKHGFFNETINSVELVLGNGDVVTASPVFSGQLIHLEFSVALPATHCLPGGHVLIVQEAHGSVPSS